MTNSTRMYRANVTFCLAYPEAFADRTAPTAAELNVAALVNNITKATNEDGTSFTLGDSDTDDSVIFCDEGPSSTPTFYNPEVTMEIFRDADVTATGEFNKAFNLMAFPDIAYIAILRVGADCDADFATGDRIKMVGVKTDFGIDVLGKGENTRMTQSFLLNDFVNWNYEVAA